MSKVRIEVYLELETFYKLNQIKEQSRDKGYTKAVNSILKRYFDNIKNQDRAVDSLNNVIQDYVGQIEDLKEALRHEKEKNNQK